MKEKTKEMRRLVVLSIILLYSNLLFGNELIDCGNLPLRKLRVSISSRLVVKTNITTGGGGLGGIGIGQPGSPETFLYNRFDLDGFEGSVPEWMTIIETKPDLQIEIDFFKVNASNRIINFKYKADPKNVSFPSPLPEWSLNIESIRDSVFKYNGCYPIFSYGGFLDHDGKGYGHFQKMFIL